MPAPFSGIDAAEVRAYVEVNPNTQCAKLRAATSFQFSANERRHSMFTRVVEITAKSGKAHELANTIQEKVLPILKKQAGFLDETVLTSDTEPNRFIGLSFWNTKEEAERYHREQYPKINEMLSPLLETAPVIRTFNVHTSTPHKIAAGKAA
jgi:quinol monooxygenase YgiN